MLKKSKDLMVLGGGLSLTKAHIFDDFKKVYQLW